MEQGGRCDFSSPSSSPSDLQVVSREGSQRKHRTSNFLMVGKLIFMFFMPNVLIFLNGCEIRGI